MLELFSISYCSSGRFRKRSEGFVIRAEYSDENPRITTACGHNYHLSCIYEWMERSNRCPVCDKVLSLAFFLFESLDADYVSGTFSSEFSL